MRNKAPMTVLVLVALLAFASGTAWANDKIISAVAIPAGEPVPIIENNGVAQGTIRLNYTVVGTQFPCGQFAQFNLGLSYQVDTGNGVSGSDLSLFVSGLGTPVQLSPDPNDFTVSGLGWSGTSLVTVNINCSKVSSTPKDGDVLDGQMNASTAPPPGVKGNAHLDTITTVQVHIKLVRPTACLKLYSFESYQDTGDLLSSVEVVTAKKFGSVKSTNPGQVSVDALVVNICSSPLSFDLQVGLDPAWETNPSGNPGNATFTYTTEGEFEPTTYNLAAFGAGTTHGETLCLTNVTLPAGDSFLTRVHSAIIRAIAAGSLPTDSNFDFSATLYAANTGCSGSPLAGVDPSNPAASHLTYTVK